MKHEGKHEGKADDRLEVLLRSTLVSHKGEAPDPAAFIDVWKGAPIRRRTVFPMRGLVVAVNLVLLVALVSFGVARRSSGPSDGVLASPAIPQGKQPVSFHGVQIFVPDTWRMHANRCGVPTADTVMTEFDGPSKLCALVSPPTGFTVAYLNTLGSNQGKALAALATEDVVIDGHPARRGAGSAPNEKAERKVLVFDDPGVVLSVESPDDAAAEEILNSARVVSTDSVGCVAKVDPLVPVAPSERQGADEKLVPGTFESASLCRYVDNWVARAVRLTESQSTSLAQILNDLPAGVSQPGPGFGAIEEECAKDRSRGFIARFAYESGPLNDVYVHIGGCTDLSATNGARTTKINHALVTLLVGSAGYDSGIPNPGELR